MEAIAIGYERDETLLSNSIKNITDETLLRELQGRGYKLDSLRENDATQPPAGEIVKIS